MPKNEIKTRLSDSYLGNNRFFGASRTSQFDCIFYAWQDEDRFIPDNSRIFRARHGGEVILIAALIGYCTMLGIDNAQMNKDFSEAKQLLDEDRDDDLTNCEMSVSMLEQYVDGFTCPPYDDKELELECYIPPISAVPAPVERVGGMGIYTHKEEIGRLSLVLASIKPDINDIKTGVKIVDSTSLCEKDVPAMSKLLCDYSVGEYRQRIKYLFSKNLSSNSKK